MPADTAGIEHVAPDTSSGHEASARAAGRACATRHRASLEVTVESVAPRVQPRWYLALSRQCRAPPSPESIQAVLRVVGLRDGALWGACGDLWAHLLDVALVLDDSYPAAWTACAAVHTQAAA